MQANHRATPEYCKVPSALTNCTRQRLQGQLVVEAIKRKDRNKQFDGMERNTAPFFQNDTLVGIGNINSPEPEDGTMFPDLWTSSNLLKITFNLQ